jgi:hypothetical protein
MTHRRNNFTKKTQREALERSNGICECHLIPHVFAVACGRQLGAGNTFFEHVDPDRLSGNASLENCAALTKTCWQIKTATYDLPIIAKTQRIFDFHNGVKDPHRRKLPGGKDDRLKKKISGEVVAR